MIGKLPDGLCPAEGLPAANCATVLVRGRTGIDPDLLSTVDAAVRDVLALKGTKLNGRGAIHSAA